MPKKANFKQQKAKKFSFTETLYELTFGDAQGSGLKRNISVPRTVSGATMSSQNKSGISLATGTMSLQGQITQPNGSGARSSSEPPRHHTPVQDRMDKIRNELIAKNIVKVPVPTTKATMAGELDNIQQTGGNKYVVYHSDEETESNPMGLNLPQQFIQPATLNYNISPAPVAVAAGQNVVASAAAGPAVNNSAIFSKIEFPTFGSETAATTTAATATATPTIAVTTTVATTTVQKPIMTTIETRNIVEDEKNKILQAELQAEKKRLEKIMRQNEEDIARRERDIERHNKIIAEEQQNEWKRIERIREKDRIEAELRRKAILAQEKAIEENMQKIRVAKEQSKLAQEKELAKKVADESYANWPQFKNDEAYISSQYYAPVEDKAEEVKGYKSDFKNHSNNDDSGDRRKIIPDKDVDYTDLHKKSSYEYSETDYSRSEMTSHYDPSSSDSDDDDDGGGGGGDPGDPYRGSNNNGGNNIDPDAEREKCVKILKETKYLVESEPEASNKEITGFKSAQTKHKQFAFINSHKQGLSLRTQIAAKVTAYRRFPIHVANVTRPLRHELQKLTYDIRNIRKDIKEIKAAHKSHMIKPVIPRDTGNCMLDIQELMRGLPPCGTVDYPASTFSEFWNKLRQWGRAKGFGHQDYLLAFGKCLQGKIHREFTALYKSTNRDFPKILTALHGMHGQEVTIHQSARELNTFTREVNEPLNAALLRLELIISSASKLWPQHERVQSTEIEKRNALMQMMLPMARNKLNQLILENKDDGTHIDFETMLEKACAYEDSFSMYESVTEPIPIELTIYKDTKKVEIPIPQPSISSAVARNKSDDSGKYLHKTKKHVDFKPKAEKEYNHVPDLAEAKSDDEKQYRDKSRRRSRSHSRKRNSRDRSESDERNRDRSESRDRRRSKSRDKHRSRSSSRNRDDKRHKSNDKYHDRRRSQSREDYDDRKGHYDDHKKSGHYKNDKYDRRDRSNSNGRNNDKNYRNRSRERKNWDENKGATYYNKNNKGKGGYKNRSRSRDREYSPSNKPNWRDNGKNTNNNNKGKWKDSKLKKDDNLNGTNVMNNYKPGGPNTNNLVVNVDKNGKGQPKLHCDNHPMTNSHTTEECSYNKRSNSKDSYRRNRKPSLNALNFKAQ